MRVFDLFCGAGGLSLGFEQAGYEVAGGLDFDPVAIQTFSLNHPQALSICADIREVSSADLLAAGPIDVLVGGPSCQGFSTHGKRLADDPRNFLFREYIRVARDLRPAWIVIENVKGLLTYDKGAFRARIHEALEELGYCVDSRVLLAADYGVPQRRERIVFLANRVGAPIIFPKPTHGPHGSVPYVSVRDAISDLPEVGPGETYEGRYVTEPSNDFQRSMRMGSNQITLQKGKHLSSYARSIVEHVSQGAGVRSLPDHLLPERFKKMRTISTGALRKDCTTLYHRLSWDAPSYTITCNFTNVSSGPFVHPGQHRAITVREAARLQSFPDSFMFAPASLPRQIGNAVPPLFGQAIAKAILAANRLASSGETVFDGLFEPRQDEELSAALC